LANLVRPVFCGISAVFIISLHKNARIAHEKKEGTIMLGFNKNRGKKKNTANARLVKKVLGKDSGRRVFGFACSPDIAARLKMLAAKLNVPIFALVEHALQLSAEVIAKAVESPEESTLLRNHLTGVHVEARTIEKISVYDQNMAERLDEERLRRLDIDRTVRQIVVGYIRRGVDPKEISYLLDYGLRCKMAMSRGRQFPPE
jgi:hypothetical protein